jgi:hypothetical protein
MRFRIPLGQFAALYGFLDRLEISGLGNCEQNNREPQCEPSVTTAGLFGVSFRRRMLHDKHFFQHQKLAWQQWLDRVRFSTLMKKSQTAVPGQQWFSIPSDMHRALRIARTRTDDPGFCSNFTTGS